MPSPSVDPAFAQRMVALGEAFSHRLSPELIRIYYVALRDIDLAVLDRAMARCIERETYFPRVATLRGYVDASDADRAVLSWATLERAAQSVGGWSRVEVRDPHAASAILNIFGSWPAFCREFNDSGYQNWTSKRIAFLAAYRQASLRVPGDPIVMEGLCSQAGSDETPPVRLLNPPPKRPGLRAVRLGELPE